MKQALASYPEATDDGSSTLYIPDLDEHYHSTKGAKTESEHVYIETAFVHRGCNPCHILEIGFGTGLNAFLSYQTAEEKKITTHYTSLELFPLTWEQIEPLHYSNHPIFEQLHRCSWNKTEPISDYFSLEKRHTDLLTFPFDGKYDVVYFDAFAPEKQPELWDETIFANLYRSMHDGGILSTYCAKGEIRRRLQRAGFRVERLPGPPNGKREILRATK